jgi:hypothetical protein
MDKNFPVDRSGNAIERRFAYAHGARKLDLQQRTQPNTRMSPNKNDLKKKPERTQNETLDRTQKDTNADLRNQRNKGRKNNDLNEEQNDQNR